MIHIFPTNRAIRFFYASFSHQNTLLPKAMSIESFFEKALRVEGRVLAQEEMRLLLMQEAVSFDAFTTLGIPQHFMAFVKNASYLFRFFEELAAEEKDLSALEGADVYAQFGEHLALLAKVRENYLAAMARQGLYDRITLPALATLDTAFIQACEAVTLHLEGYLSAFEWRIMEAIAQHIPLHVKLVSTPYNRKVTDYLATRGISFPVGETGEVALHVKQTHTQKVSLPPPVLCASAFSARSLQVGYVFDKIAWMLEQGLEPKEIAVVLPDESFVPLLRLYDKAHNLNFAMGQPLRQSRFVQRLLALRQALGNENQASLHRLARLGISAQWRAQWQKAWNNPLGLGEFEALLGSAQEETLPVQELLTQGCERINHLHSVWPHLPFSALLTLFLRHVEGLRLDDVMGGPVTVMGVLETRGVAFKGVIVPDFNDDLVPRRSDKDLFLSSALRHHAGLPDKEDREHLQRYYYARLFDQASYVAIAYVENEEKLPSRFLQTLPAQQEWYDGRIGTLLMPPIPPRWAKEEEIVLEHHPFETPLSATRLKSLLSCKRHYYYRYIQKIQTPTLPSDTLLPLEVGQALHRCLEKAAMCEGFGEDAKKTLEIVRGQLEEHFGKSAAWELEKEVWKERLRTFCDHEAQRHGQGWRPWKLEANLSAVFGDVRLEGKIDRIDKHHEGTLEVLDYKTGKTLKSGPLSLENMVDFQLQFYGVLAGQLGEVAHVGYYDLLQGVSVREEKMQERLSRLSTLLQEYRVVHTFEKTTKQAQCAQCPYALVCNRG